MDGKKIRTASIAFACLAAASAFFLAWPVLRAEPQPPPEPTSAQLAEDARIALTKLMARISVEDDDGAGSNLSRAAAGEAMLSVLENWKRQLVKTAGAPIKSGMDNKQQISLRILEKMSPESDEIEMLVNNVATFSPYPIQLSDNPWQEYPYCRALWQREATFTLLPHYRGIPPEKVSDLEIKLVAGIIESRLGDKHYRRADLAEPLLKYEISRGRNLNIERIEKQWQKIAAGDSGAPEPSDRPLR